VARRRSGSPSCEAIKVGPQSSTNASVGFTLSGPVANSIVNRPRRTRFGEGPRRRLGYRGCADLGSRFGDFPLGRHILRFRPLFEGVRFLLGRGLRTFPFPQRGSKFDCFVWCGHLRHFIVRHFVYGFCFAFCLFELCARRYDRGCDDFAIFDLSLDRFLRHFRDTSTDNSFHLCG
jgi:hypothetical protein